MTNQPEHKLYYVVMLVHDWNNYAVKIGHVKLGCDISDGSIGWMSVYDSREAAEAAYPGATINLAKLITMPINGD